MTIGAVIGRLGALALAILLVVGALALRNRDGGTAGPDGANGTETAAPADPGTVRCAAELGICQQLAVLLGDDVDVIAEDGVTAARSLRDASRTEVWVTLSSLVDVVEESRARASRGPLFVADAPVIGSSPLVLAGNAERMAALEATCGLTWSCLGDVAGRPWSDAGGQTSWGLGRPGLSEPNHSGIGLLTLGQAVASRLDGQVVSTRNLDAPEVTGWFSQVADVAVVADDPLRQLIQFQGSVDVVGLTEAEAADVLGRVASPPFAIRVVAGTPPVTAEVVLAVPVGSSAPRGLADVVAQALADTGWRVPDVTPGAVLPTPIEVPTGEPPTLTGGALEAVLLRWEQAR